MQLVTKDSNIALVPGYEMVEHGEHDTEEKETLREDDINAETSISNVYETNIWRQNMEKKWMHTCVINETAEVARSGKFYG